ncbi:rab GTPase-activating protein 1 isoform X1 [Halyomorpha halys]|uniref:rab GTPase-activating protein 1 isoform X1 n=2 Tax=Halyomorpha halys TaxID=286706 RepID=UPI0006D4FFA4|nr:rab GTPase-activating protein 1 isoform X1 [Halyomorpha halys]XP_014284416.1 rab GTPase-activating protein 1 isoform X1 [Halyomorpha halys]XP_014284417.1 rab GTPase-activating protein 1 isoform X1 [Halyomorpha halys]XP_024214659.1 rab GTPase-activating protein 1 isoform X1 [Halyomorpha halys]
MEDSVSVKSSDSTAVSDEFEIINGQTVVTASSLPQLKIAGDGSLEGLWQCLGEMLKEDIDNNQKQMSVDENDEAEHSQNESIEELGDVHQDCTIFNGVSYLGAAAINAPKSDTEIQRNMVILNESIVEAIKVSISIPSCSDGSVVLYDGVTNIIMQKYEICRILFYAHGKPNSNEAACFAFTWTHGDTLESSIFQCHVFRCDIPEAVGQVSACFMKAFQRVPKSLSTSINGELPTEGELLSNIGNIQVFVLDLTMDIKEDDGKGNFNAVPRDRSCFKLRCNIEKQVCLTITQVSTEGQKKLEVKRCFGVLIAPGKHVKHSDMQLLDMASMGSEKVDDTSYVITGLWDPKDPAFELLNTETEGKDKKVYLTVAVDLVVRGITEPVRLLVETLVRVYHQGERFWYFTRRPLVQPFSLNLKEVMSLDNEPNYEVVSIETSGEIDRSRLNLTLNNLASYIRSPSITSMDTLTPRDDYNSDGDEPLLSGTGNVSKDCSMSDLESWRDVLTKWSGARPRQLGPLVRQGIPEALRGEVWQRLANCDSDTAVMDNYRILITKESNCEAVIQRDINRTFPAHEFFKEGSGGGGQDSLFRISKAYAVHDTEVGYCQGLSFLAATLLLHMPEEQAFCVLLKVMYDYGLRELYKDGFECLRLRLYQLNRLMEEQLPQLYHHFQEKGVESHMFASQWFLTLYTARFPLYFVFHIIDVFLLQGTDTLFQVALALLTMCKKDLLQLDFESILKYFRVTLPKKCRNYEVARGLMKVACCIKVKKLKKYEQEFLDLKEAEENADKCTSELERLKCELVRSEEEKKRLEEQLVQVKDMLKREVEKAEEDNRRNSSIIDGYKAICERLDKEQQAAKNSLNSLLSLVASCEKCSHLELKIGANGSPTNNKGLEENDSHLMQRVTELELELAQAKLAQVEAECKNQDLTHKLGATLSEMQAARNSWPPWLSKTLTSIKEAAVNKGTLQRRESDSADPPA